MANIDGEAGARLRDYTVHRVTCGIWVLSGSCLVGAGTCTCGLDALLAPVVSPPQNIPEFIEPRYWIEQGMHGWGVFYRQEGRKLGVGCVQGVSEVVARNVAKALNDVLYEEVTAYRASAPVVTQEGEEPCKD